MILQQVTLVFLCQLIFLKSQEISNICVCGHVKIQTECENSGFCIWQNNLCVLKSGEQYNNEVLNKNPCKSYAQEDCRNQEQCGFYFGKCIEFTSCNKYHKDYCQESSYRCVSDGKKCIEILECSDYKTQDGCSNKNSNGKYCFWNLEIRQCFDAIRCEELPIYLNTHQICSEGIEECTVGNNEYGCIIQMESCIQYLNDFQCFQSRSTKKVCFWDIQKRQCVDKVCENLYFSQDYECKSQLSECTSNGIHCIKRKQCSDAKSKFGCVTDEQGNKCEYHQNQCKIKDCNTAPELFKSYQQCQDYDNLLDCVTSENGGCKKRPNSCDGYANERDCFSIKQQDCWWYNNKCEQRQCYHAPVHYSFSECKQYGNCIGKLGGGCTETPQLCEQILEQQFCDLNYNKVKCIWLDNGCAQLDCNQLKLPNYKNHNICNSVSQYCTFNLESLGCSDYICENILELEYCQIDSRGTVCTMNQGCIEKECRTAPPTYDTNQKCEQWLPICTVNVQVLQTSKILIGCVDKSNDCQQALEDQCYSTINGFYCQWNRSSKTCENQDCIDANPNLYKTNQDCQTFKVLVGSCIISPYGVGCQQWPINCELMMNQEQCLLNLKDGTQCFWTGSSCKLKECSDASRFKYKDNISCNTWLKICIYNSIFGGCMNRPNSVACTSSPNNSMYNTHQKCFAWNPNCTVISSINVEGCELKKQDCHDYIRKRNCRTRLDGQNCYWDDIQEKCNNEDEDNDGIVDCHRRVYGDLSHEDCQDFLSKCTLSNFTRSCQTLSDYCDYQYQQQCVITREWQPCKWDYYNQICTDVQCGDNTSALTESECLNFRRNNECQLKINSNGSYGLGCESRPSYCQEITNSTICNLTLTTRNVRCYYFSFQCQNVQSKNCEVITNSKSNELCQLYNSSCILQPSGLGCYSINRCSDLSTNICNNSIMKFNKKVDDNKCSEKHLSLSGCQQNKTTLGQLCTYTYSSSTQMYYCIQESSNFLKSFIFPVDNVDGRMIECQYYSSSYTYDITLQLCIQLTSCNQQYSNENICNHSLSQPSLNQQTKCGFNTQTNTCENRKCEHLSLANQHSTCYDWNYNCVLDTVGCKTFAGDCTKVQLIYQCLSLNCVWQQGTCIDHINCQLQTDAITDHECLLVNAQQCRLNYTKGYGCAFTDCSNIRNSFICNQATLVDGVNCYWHDGYCFAKACSIYSDQSSCENSYGYNEIATKCYWCIYNLDKCSNQKYCSPNTMNIYIKHEDCNNLNVLQTINFQTSQKCTVKKQFCLDYTYQSACVNTLVDISCEWDGTLCKNICRSQNSNSNEMCFQFRPYCKLNETTTNTCLLLECIGLVENICRVFTSKCFWNGSLCKTVGSCIDYPTIELCQNTYNSKGSPCFWDESNIKCIEKTCENKPTNSNSQSDCNNWLQNCQFNSNNQSCVQDCTQADISNVTHDQCESYYQNKSCTVKVDSIQCVDIPLSCSLAKKPQCFQDKDGKECYFQVTLNKCVDLTCINLDESYKTHEKCNQKLKSCTVNATLNGCQYLNDCNNYSKKEQCYIDLNNLKCQWMINSNLCTIKECSTAQLNLYTAYSCQQYFDDSCTVNSNSDGCEIGKSFCKDYTETQCKSDGQKNLKGKQCYWDKEKSKCMERICENGPSIAKAHSDCIAFLPTCQKGGCRTKGCFDYIYANDSACAQIFEDKRCVTNGYGCVLRQACEDVNMIDGCPFDKYLQPCVWVDDKCLTKTCETAQTSLTKYEECLSYLPYCTSNQGGGCVRKQRCQNYHFKEACFTSDQNEECIWDDYLNKCFPDLCIGYCGDGIVSNKEEQCDDGNQLPYDGCYKCQIQCPQGCFICNGSLCMECLKNGWYLIAGACNSVCGDGYATGNEWCDDGNDIEFDGCYNCSYSCHQLCIDCFQGQCIQCKQGYLEDGSQCLSVCGDGYLVSLFEQCDDGNNNNNDGCNHKCIVEQDWKCQEINNLSTCTYTIIPHIKLTKISKTDTRIQEFLLSFSEPVRLNIKGISEEQFLQMIFVYIQDAKDQQYDVEVKSSTPITNDLADVSYKILLDFKTYISNPLLKVQIKCNDIVNEQNNNLKNNEASLQLRSPNKISDTQQSLIVKTALLGKTIIYIILIVSAVAFLCGNLEILWNLLDMLQQLSYLKYHNIQFPENLLVYFEIFSIGSFTPIIQGFEINIYFEEIIDFQIPNIPGKWKFQQYSINCYFLQNFQTLIILVFLGFFYYVLSYLFYKFLFLIKYQNLTAAFFNYFESDIFIKTTKYIFSFQKLFRKYCQYFIYSGVIRILTSNFYEITFSSVLQFANLNFDTSINITSSITSLISLMFNIILQVFAFLYLSQSNEVKKHLSVLVEGINYKANFGSKQYFTILLIKKTLFIINLVLFQGLVAFQSIITAGLSGLFSCYVRYYKPFENKYENLKIFITEILITINAIIFSIYEILNSHQNKDIVYILGWINVSCITMILILNLAIDIYQQLSKYFKLVIDKFCANFCHKPEFLQTNLRNF